MKGILLAGGTGSRLRPLTSVLSKQLLPVYDKPMIYYPLSTLMLAGIQDILIIVTPQHETLFREQLGDGQKFGINISYKVQDTPSGIAEAVILGEKFTDGATFSLILGDNIFFGQGLTDRLMSARSKISKGGAVVFGYNVRDPSDFGVITIDESGGVVSIEEKPEQPKSNIAATGLYFFDGKAAEYAKTLSPSQRGELEITDLLKLYLGRGALSLEMLGRGFAWLDTGSHENIMQASQFVSTVEARQGFKIACLEEISMNNGWLTKGKVKQQIEGAGNSSYYRYIRQLLTS